MMKSAVVVAGVALVGMLVCVSGAQAAGIKEGQWSMTMTIQADGMGQEAAAAMKEMDNMPPEQKAMMQQMMGKMHMGASGQGMTISASQCITNAHPVPQREEQKGCHETHAIKGNTVHFDVVCADSTSSGNVTYDNDAMNGRMTSTHTEHGRQMTSTIDVRGHYEGPCN